MLVKIVREIEQAKDEFCATVTLQHYLTDSNDPSSFVDENKLFAVSDIHHVLKESHPSVISVSGQTQLDATKFTGLKSFLCYGKLTAIARYRGGVIYVRTVKIFIVLF